MAPLEPSGAIVCGSVGFVSDRRALEANGPPKNGASMEGDLVADGPAESVAAAARVDAGSEKHFGGVDVTDSGSYSLVEKGDLNGPPRMMNGSVKFGAGQAKGVWANGRWPVASRQGIRIQQPDRAEPTAIPEDEGRAAVVQRHDKPHMLVCGRRHPEKQTGHAGLDDQPNWLRIGCSQFDDSPFSDSGHGVDLAACELASQQGRPWTHRAWSPRPAWGGDLGNRAPDNVTNATAHGLDFRKFRHLEYGRAGLGMDNSVGRGEGREIAPQATIGL